MAKTLQVTIVGNADSLKRAFGQAGGDSKRFGSQMSKMGGLAKGALLGVGAAAAGGLAVGLKRGWDEMMEGQKVSAQTAAALKSTGGAAGITQKGIEALASSISKKSGIDDEAIQSGQNLLLTFANLRNETGKGNDIFNQATLAVTDMSVAMGTDMKSAAIQIGKAMNDPLKGLSALTRVGVTFTAGQKASIKAMVASGNAMGAQKLILKELNKEFGGSAKAAGDTLPGQLNKMKNAFDEAAGGLMTKLLPHLTKFVNWVTENMPAIQAAFKQAGAVISGVFGKLSGVFDGLGQFLKGWVQIIKGLLEGDLSMIWQGLKNVWIGELKAIWAGMKLYAEMFVAVWSKIGGLMLDAGMAGLTELAKPFVAFGEMIQSTTAAAWNAVSAALDTVWAVITSTVTTSVDAVKSAVSAAWSAVQTLTSTAWAAIKTAVMAPINAAEAVVKTSVAAARTAVTTAWTAISTATTTAWNGIRTAVATAINAAELVVKTSIAAARTAVSAAWTAIQTLTSSVWNAIKTAVSTAINAAEAVVKTSVAAARTALASGWNAARTVTSDAWNAIKTAVGNAIDKVKEEISRIKGNVASWIGDLSGVLASAGRDLIHGFINGITSMFGKVQSTLGGLASKAVSWKGPPSYDRKVLVPAGKAFMEGFINGITSKHGDLKSALGEVSSLASSLAPSAVRVGKVSSAVARVGLPVPASVPAMAGGGHMPGGGMAMAGGGNTYNFHFPNYVGNEQDLVATVRRELLRTGKRNGGGVLGGLG